MDMQEELETVDGVAVFRPTGEVSFEEAVQLVATAIMHARDRRTRKLMAVVSGLNGFEPPSLGQRYWMANEWALAADGALGLAVVARPEHIDPQRVGILLAEQAGFTAKAFESEEEALTWLKELIPD